MISRLKYTYSDLTGKRIFGLDLVRALAVCCVVAAHSGYDYIGPLRYGVIAIEYFFVMSGFLIGEMLIKEFYSGVTPKTLVNFWIKRWFRTIPLYYLILTIKILATKTDTLIWPYYLFLQNHIGGIKFFAVSWTLVIEEWFYLIMPLVIFLFFRNGIEKKKFLLFSIFVIVMENVFRILYVELKDVPWGGIVGSFPFRFDSFMIGVFIAFIKIDYPSLFRKMTHTRFFILLNVVFLIYLIWYGMSNGGELASKTYWTRTVGFTLTSLILALQLPFLSSNKILNTINDRNILKQCFTWLSILSYPIYLIHMDFLGFFQTQYSLLNIVANYSLIIFLSYLLIVLFHQPITASRKNFLLK